MYDFLPDIKRIYLSHIACQKIFYNNTPGFQINCWEKKIRLMKTSLRKLLFKFFNYWEERAKNRCKIRLWLRQHGEKKLSEYGDFFWSVFSPIWADYENLLWFSPKTGKCVPDKHPYGALLRKCFWSANFVEKNSQQSSGEVYEWIFPVRYIFWRTPKQVFQRGLLTKFRMKTFVVDYIFRKQIHMVNKGPLTKGLDLG